MASKSATRTRRGFGKIRKLPSGRYQASYIGPDAVRHTAPSTFTAKDFAEGWLAGEAKKIDLDTWTPPLNRHAEKDVLRFGEYATAWLAERDKLKPRTRSHYKSLIERHLEPTFGDMALEDITAPAIRRWHSVTLPGKPTMRSHAYSLLRTILGTAYTDRIIDHNPAHIRGAGSTPRKTKTKVLTMPELADLVSHMPAKHQAMTMLATWCALRFGELTELRRKDVDLENGVVHISRAVARADGEVIIGKPKTEAGIRDVAIPPHIVPMIEAHLHDHARPGKDGLLFPADSGGNLAPSALYGRKPSKKRPGYGFYAARQAIGKPDLRWHDLRHTGAVLAALSGATIAELMGRLGHSTAGAAMIYQSVAEGRDKELAAKLSAMAEGMK